jgi:hypothetical protein
MFITTRQSARVALEITVCCLSRHRNPKKLNGLKTVTAKACEPYLISVMNGSRHDQELEHGWAIQLAAMNNFIKVDHFRVFSNTGARRAHGEQKAQQH